VRTVTKLCILNKIRCVKVGYQWRINRAALIRYTGTRRIVPTVESEAPDAYPQATGERGPYPEIP